MGRNFQYQRSWRLAALQGGAAFFAKGGRRVLEKLIERLNRAAIEHAGAERGLLIVPRGDKLQIEAEANIGGEGVTVHLRDGTPTPAALPESFVRYRLQLPQVFMNLMLNAIEAMKDSGGELTVKSELQDGQLQFSVSDTGVGLPMEKRDQVFSAFFTTKPQGSGMGLAISRSMVESQGQLWASANSGGGPTFNFTLPIQVTESSPLVARGTSSSPEYIPKP
ncbi:MAG: ATP-binding protein [Candidatus Sulfotelmatobacter sp.]